MLEDSFANRLKKALVMKNMKPVDLANKTGINKSLISNYLSGTFKAKQDKLTLIAETLGVSEGWLMGYDVPIERTETLPTHPDDSDNFYIKVSTPMVKIPILGKVTAGVPIEAIEEILGYEEIPQSWEKNNYKYFALQVNGDSMYPDYHKGDIIIIRQQNDCDSGDDCIVMVNGDDATFKRVIKHKDNIILKPLNNNFEPYSYSEYDVMSKPVKIIGIVVEVRRRIKK